MKFPDFPLSDYMWFDEMTRTWHKELQDDNVIQAVPHIPVMCRFLQRNIDPIREYLALPLPASSGFRCPALNAAVGGATSSLHMAGRAVDLKRPEWTWDSIHKDVGPKILKCAFGADLKIKVILERKGFSTWIHISESLENSLWDGDNGVYRQLPMN